MGFNVLIAVLVEKKTCFDGRESFDFVDSVLPGSNCVRLYLSIHIFTVTLSISFSSDLVHAVDPSCGLRDSKSMLERFKTNIE